MSELRPGESIDLGTRCNDGPTIQRDEHCTDGFAIDNHGGELYQDEIKRIAEIAGFGVVE